MPVNAQLLTMNEYTTYAELMSKINGDENVFSHIAKEFVTKQTLARDLPVHIVNGTFDDTQLFMEPWEYNRKSKTTSISDGANFYKDGLYKRREIMGMRDSAIAIDENEYEASTFSKLWRASQADNRLHDIGMDTEHDFVWGNPRVDPKSCLGLVPRFNRITDMDGIITSGEHQGERYPYITIDAGGQIGQNGNLCSMLLVYPSNKEGVCILVPNGAKTNYSYGIEFRTGKFQDYQYTDENGLLATKRQAVDVFKMTCGIGMRSRNAAIRIANIDATTDEGIKKFIDSMYEACEAFPQVEGGIIGYCPADLRVKVRRYFDNKVNTAVYGEKMKTFAGDFEVGGVNFRKLVHLKANENHVS